MGQRKYEKGYKVQAVKLAQEIGAGRAAKELGVPVDALYGWQKAVREQYSLSRHITAFRRFSLYHIGTPQANTPLPCKNSQPLLARAAKSCPLRKKFLSIRPGHDMMRL